MTEYVNIEIQYFKQSGKYYSTGYLYNISKDSNVMETLELLKEKLRNKIMPGLTGYEDDFYIYVSFRELDTGYPFLLKAKDYV